MTYFYGWFTILCISLLGSMIPGVSFALVLRNTLRSSRATGIWTAFGLATGISVYTVIVLMGLALVILRNPILSKAICLLGAIYLAYVGLQSVFAQPKTSVISIVGKNEIGSSIPSKNAFLMGFFTNLLNPKVMLFFIALFTQFIHPGMSPTMTWIYGMTVIGVEFSWFSFVAILLTHPVLEKKFHAFSHWIERISGIVLLSISVHLVHLF